ncbi:hypothetical protein [Rhodococcus sp. RDE2]|uniref:hypothetical protein n=1 Tax=Rhodococcus sp. RDE2 TaxID=2885078 RepID=UPI001E4C99AC|nr:hypothetical protein [Rhodococcus sp. RDE2]BDB59752.1 hypothetical protein RDE2_15460 [Rhodococcus sp. RDE2]
MTTSESCVKGLRELAADERCKPRADDLELLAKDIESGDSDKWVGIDLLAAFPASTTASVRKFGIVESLLGAIAAIAVFAPVAWTWFSLRAASQAYSNMTADGIRPDDTFLGLWISGFDGYLTGWHRLSWVALVSILVIVVAVLLVIAQRVVSSAADKKEDEEAVAFEARRISVLCAAQREIGGQHTADPSAIEAIVRSSIKKLSEAHDATKEGIDRLNATSASLETTAATMTAAADATQSSLQGVEYAAKVLETTADESQRRMAKTLDHFTDQLQDQLTKAQSETGRVVAQSSDAIRSTIDDLVAGVALMERSQSAIAGSVDTMDRRSVDTGRELQAAVFELRSAVEGIDRSLLRHESALQAQASDLTSARDAVEMMLRRLELMGHEQSGDHVETV